VNRFKEVRPAGLRRIMKVPREKNRACASNSLGNCTERRKMQNPSWTAVPGGEGPLQESEFTQGLSLYKVTPKIGATSLGGGKGRRTSKSKYRSARRKREVPTNWGKKNLSNGPNTEPQGDEDRRRA